MEQFFAIAIPIVIVLGVIGFMLDINKLNKENDAFNEIQKEILRDLIKKAEEKEKKK